MSVNNNVGFKVKEMLVGKFDYSAEEFDAPLTVPFANSFNSNPERDTDSLKDDGMEKLYLSVATGYRPTLETAGLNKTLEAVFNNVTVASEKITMNLGSASPTWGCIVYLALANGSFAYWAAPNNVVETWDPIGENSANGLAIGTLEWMAGALELSDGTVILPALEVVADLTGKPTDKATFNSFFGITVA